MSISRRYKKRPTVVEAVCLNQTNKEEVKKWLSTPYKERSEGLVITTLEGDMLAEWGSYIVKGVKGEFYPVRRDIFQITYDVHAAEEE